MWRPWLFKRPTRFEKEKESTEVTAGWSTPLFKGSYLQRAFQTR